MFFVVIFFFKQKTAYEMRISDWSSDVCSSDLPKWAVEIVGVGLAVSGQDRIPCVAEGHRMVTVPDSVLLFRIVFGRALTKFRISTKRPLRMHLQIGRASCRERVGQ